MVSLDDGFSWVAPRIARRDFIGYLQAHAAEGVLAERDPGAYYDAIAARHVEPGFVLFMFERESSLGKAGEAVTTHAWGNMRVGRDFQDVPTTGDFEGFAKFADWLTGAEATAAHLDTDLYRGLTIREAIAKWAPEEDGNDPLAYAQGIVDGINAILDNPSSDPPPPTSGGTMRVILSAGHLNIGDITDERLGAGEGDRLRGATGALGTEAEPNTAVRDAAAALLSRAGVDVVTTDAIWHEDVYSQDADLLVFIHHDGEGIARSAPQRSGAAVVQSGNPTDAANATAQAFVDAWKTDSAAITGIADTGITSNNMSGYYGGWYRTSATPAAIVEGSVWGDAEGQRPDVDTGREGHAIAAAVAQALQIGGENVPGIGEGDPAPGGSPGIGDDGGGGVAEDIAAGWRTQDDGSIGRRFAIPGTDRSYFVGHGIAEYYRAAGYPDLSGLGIANADPDRDPSPVFGFPISDEFAYPHVDGVRIVQYCQRCRFEVDADGKVSLALIGREAANQLDPIYRHLLYLG